MAEVPGPGWLAQIPGLRDVLVDDGSGGLEVLPRTSALEIGAGLEATYDVGTRRVTLASLGDATSLLGIDLDPTTFGAPTDTYVITYDSASGEFILAAAGGLFAPADPGDDDKVAIASAGDLTYALLTDVNVDLAAAIAGSKIAPDFGAQDLITTGLIRYGGGASLADGALNQSFEGRASGVLSTAVTLVSFDPTVLVGATQGMVSVAVVVHVYNSAAGDWAYVERKARFRWIGSGAVTQVGTTEKVADDGGLVDGVDYTVDIDVSAGAIRVRVADPGNDGVDFSCTGSWVGSTWS